MADHVDITLWIDRRWKNAIEKNLKGETLQEHLENVLDELCNQLPEQEYERISCILRRTAAVGAVVQRPLCGLSSGRN